MQKINDKLNNLSDQERELYTIRHSAEHVLMQAMRNLGYNFHMAMGPATDEGFYFDFEVLDDNPITEDDFKKIEKEMKHIIKQNQPITRDEISPDEARTLFKNNPYKQEWITEAEGRGEAISIYWTGEPHSDKAFVDLCAGPHVEATGKIGVIKLLSVAGAYWRGDENNIMLTRIYGTAFKTQEELDHYLNMLEEAQKRDHRTLGQTLEIFTTSNEVGQGLILWLPNGTIVRDELEHWAKETETKWGYQQVHTPHITKKDLYEISGHLPYYAEDLYSPIDIEGEEYYLKPMNCPHHHMIYKNRPRSYRELPLRLAEYGQVYRFERSGTLHGLMRVRGFAQNDAHIYVKPENAVDEFVSVFEMHKYYYEKLGISDWWVVLGLRDKDNLRSKYHGDDEMWEKAEGMTREALEKANVQFEIDEGGAAHYGPKGDIFVKSVIGKEYAIGTVQLDLFMPKQFDLSYVDQDGDEKMPYIIHRAPLGSHERMVGFLLEHFAGAFPVWLHPTQMAILPLNDNLVEYAEEVRSQILETIPQARIEIDAAGESLQKKIRNAQLQKTPYMLVVGNREKESGVVNVRLRTEEEIGEVSVGEFAEKVKGIIANRSLDLW